jgi:hypothetical protein
MCQLDVCLKNCFEHRDRSGCGIWIGISTMAKKTKPQKKSGAKRSWSKEDDRLLKTMAGKEPLAKIAAALKRTVGATRNRATMSSNSLSTRPKKRTKAAKKAS